MRCLKTFGTLSLVASALVVACAAPIDLSDSTDLTDPTDPSGGDEENVDDSESSISKGVVDTKHPAVVLLIDAAKKLSCTGTIVKTDVATKIGWVLTSPTCSDKLKPATAIVATNGKVNERGIRYQVLDRVVDPKFDAKLGKRQFAMLRILGVDASTPTIPLAEGADGVAKGARVTVVGFGNGRRMSIDKTFQYASEWFLSVSLKTGGKISSIDHGAPILINRGGTERLVGIVTGVVGGSTGSALGSRASYSTDFFKAQFAKPAPPMTCDLAQAISGSGTNECATRSSACAENKDCKGFADCAVSGKTADECASAYPLGIGPFSVYLSCYCRGDLASACASQEICQIAPKCGIARVPSDHTTCMETSCCAEQMACSADGQCFLCARNGGTDPKCASNAAYQKVEACSKDRCTNVGAPTAPEEPKIDVQGPVAPLETTEVTPVSIPVETASAPPAEEATEGGCSASPSGPSTSTLGLGLLLGLAALARRRGKGQPA